MSGPPAEVHVLSRVLDEPTRTLSLHLSDGATYDVAPDAPEVQELTAGDTVDAQLRGRLEDAAQRKQAARDVFQLLDRRQYSRSRLAAKLNEKGYSAAVIDPVLDSCEAQGLIDDLAFAQAYCRDQLRRRPVGRGWLQQKLRQQGIGGATIDSVVSDLVIPVEGELARDALAKRAISLQDAKGQAKAMRFLQSRGFPSGLCRAVVMEASHREPRGAI